MVSLSSRERFHARLPDRWRCGGRGEELDERAARVGLLRADQDARREDRRLLHLGGYRSDYLDPGHRNQRADRLQADLSIASRNHRANRLGGDHLALAGDLIRDAESWKDDRRQIDAARAVGIGDRLRLE